MRNIYVTYENHNGDEIKFNQGAGYWINGSDMFDYSWDIASAGDILDPFKRGIKKFTVEAFTLSDDEGLALRNHMHDVFEADVRANRYGTLKCNGYELKCYIVSSSKRDAMYQDRYMGCTLEVVTDRTFWVKKEKHSFDDSEAIGGSVTPYYPYNYPNNYANAQTASTTIRNTSVAPCDCKITVYGVRDNCTVSIGKNSYAMGNMDIGTRKAYLEIDTADKTAWLYKQRGDNAMIRENAFPLRNRLYYLFNKIDVGDNEVLLENGDTLDVTLYLERSEPEWI